MLWYLCFLTTASTFENIRYLPGTWRWLCCRRSSLGRNSLCTRNRSVHDLPGCPYTRLSRASLSCARQRLSEAPASATWAPAGGRGSCRCRARRPRRHRSARRPCRRWAPPSSRHRRSTSPTRCPPLPAQRRPCAPTASAPTWPYDSGAAPPRAPSARSAPRACASRSCPVCCHPVELESVLYKFLANFRQTISTRMNAIAACVSPRVFATSSAALEFEEPENWAGLQKKYRWS